MVNEGRGRERGSVRVKDRKKKDVDIWWYKIVIVMVSLF